MYTLTATLEYLGGGGTNWAALGFQTQADLTNSQFHGAAGNAYAWVLVRKAGGGQPQFFGGGDTANGGGFATGSQSGLQTVTITLDTTGLNWTSHATINGFNSATVTYGTNPTGIAYVGFGGVGTTSNTTNFSLTTNANISTRTLTYSAGANGSISGTTPQTVAYGADGTAVTAVANSSYHFVYWSDGVMTASRTDLAVTTDRTVTASFAIDIPANELIYSDTLLGSGSALHGTTVDSSATHAGGTAGATWTAAGSYNETATGTIGTSTTTQGAYLPFTPQAGHVYTLTATLEYLGAVPSNWAALGFQTQADVAHGAFHDASGAAYAWTLLRKAGGGQPQFFGGPDTANGGGFATGSESGLQTVTITLDTTGASWTSHATINGLDSATVTYGTNPTDIAYVGFGGVGTTSNTTHFSLSATGGNTPYDAWKAGSFANAFTDTDPTHDPDGDGLTNQQEFAFGLDPTTGASVNPITQPFDKSTGKFRYTRTATSGLTYTVWTSENLQDWTEDLTATAGQTDQGTVNGVQTVEVTITDPAPLSGKLFVRVQAQ